MKQLQVLGRVKRVQYDYDGSVGGNISRTSLSGRRKENAAKQQNLCHYPSSSLGMLIVKNNIPREETKKSFRFRNRAYSN